MFKIVIKTDNAAFEDDPTHELIRILETVNVKLGDGQTSGIVRDINGNKVGEFELTDD